jgi:hypothetical protein
MYSEFVNIKEKLSRYDDHYNNTIYARRLLAFFSPTNRHYPMDPNFDNNADKKIPLFLSAAVENELVACKKSVFLGQTKDLIYELSYLKDSYPRKAFYISSGTFENGFRNSIVWSFWNAGRSRVPSYFRLLIEAGVRDGVLGLRKNKFYYKRRIGTKIVQDQESHDGDLGITGSIQTIFFIWLGGLAVAGFTFIAESFPRKETFVVVLSNVNLKPRDISVCFRYLVLHFYRDLRCKTLRMSNALRRNHLRVDSLPN